MVRYTRCGSCHTIAHARASSFPDELVPQRRDLGRRRRGWRGRFLGEPGLHDRELRVERLRRRVGDAIREPARIRVPARALAGRHLA
jgi:hypothetical protein